MSKTISQDPGAVFHQRSLRAVNPDMNKRAASVEKVITEIDEHVVAGGLQTLPLSNLGAVWVLVVSGSRILAEI